MKPQTVLFWLGIWFLLFSGGAMERSHKARSTQPVPAAQQQMAPSPAGFLSPARPTAIPPPPAPTASSPARAVTVSLVLLLTAWLRLGKHRLNQRQRPRKPRDYRITPEWLGVTLSVLTALIIGVGSVLLCMVWLGLGWASLGGLALALLLGLILSSIVLILLILPFALTMGNSGGSGFAGHVARGCEKFALAILIAGVLIPAALIVGAFSIVLIMSWILSIQIGFWLGLACWLTIAAGMVGGYVVGILVSEALGWREGEKPGTTPSETPANP